MTPVFLGEWSNEAEMLRDFNISEAMLQDAKIIVAAYDYECYEGYAFVLFERFGKLYEVNGSHCSCYGLSEDSVMGGTTQWQPEEVSREVIASGRRDFYGSSHINSVIQAYLEATK